VVARPPQGKQGTQGTQGNTNNQIKGRNSDSLYMFMGCFVLWRGAGGVAGQGIAGRGWYGYEVIVLFTRARVVVAVVSC